ncbi:MULTISPECIES: hypothetical protein [Pseudomonas]|jgi:hypothetical protein|uniref:hypothetical protein n=1 Tax=Pseudomonas TaxID=286 RepID=UPI0008123D78|nr:MULTISPECIES: hypothetical protein [Pseudomonas]WPN25376.1 hypothetical protein QMK57_08435 [Pseudomonas marginalis]CRM89537.1 hypothetical protein [Pseudomonas sp. 22 E 5]
MNEGWQNDDYFIIFTEDESLAAMKAYGFDHHLPGYTLLGLRGWDDFIVINSSGVMFTIPTLPLDASYAAPFALPQQISLEPDERFAGKIKWYTKPLVFGGDPADKTNFAWITHEQHAELVIWWNEQCRSAKSQS